MNILLAFTPFIVFVIVERLAGPVLGLLTATASACALLETWNTPEFVRSNHVISAVWALAFAVIVGAGLLLLYKPSLPVQIGAGTAIVAVWGVFALRPGTPGGPVQNPHKRKI
jgi:hypothetical protein